MLLLHQSLPPATLVWFFPHPGLVLCTLAKHPWQSRDEFWLPLWIKLAKHVSTPKWESLPTWLLPSTHRCPRDSLGTLSDTTGLPSPVQLGSWLHPLLLSSCPRGSRANTWQNRCSYYLNHSWMTLLLLVIKYRLSIAYRQKIKLFGIKYETHQDPRPASFSSLISYQLFPSALYSGLTQLLVITLKC